MTLPYVREVAYLSPTSFMQARDRPVEFYLRRLGPEELKPPKPPQTEPMATGSIFDAHVKAVLAHKLGVELPASILRDQVQRQHLEPGSAVLAEGLRLFKAYQKSPAWKHLINDGLDEVEVPTETTLVGGAVNFGGIPIWGKPDAAMRKNNTRSILDWKVNGAFSERGGSPRPGYLRLWDRGFDVGPHNKYGSYLDDLDKYWATQCAMYCWMIDTDHDINEPCHAAIEQIIVTPDKTRFAQFRCMISPKFQRQLLADLQEIWDKIHNETLVTAEDLGMGTGKDAVVDLELLKLLY